LHGAGELNGAVVNDLASRAKELAIGAGIKWSGSGRGPEAVPRRHGVSVPVKRRDPE